MAAPAFGAEGASGGAPVMRARETGAESTSPGRRDRGQRQRGRSIQRGPTPPAQDRYFGSEGADDPGHVATADV
jgi:hypothetical protein